MNNKLIAVMVLFVAGLVFAQSETSIAKPAPREHRGFYSVSSFAFAYNWYDASMERVDEFEDYEDYDKPPKNVKEKDVDYYEFNGLAFPEFDFKFGVAVGNLIAFHTNFDFGFFTGPIDHFYKEYRTECNAQKQCTKTTKEDEDEEYSSDAYTFRTFIGFGTTLYPFRNKVPVMEGFFVGGSYGYSMFLTYIQTGRSGCANFGPSFKVELGKEWWVGDHMSMGVGLGYARSELMYASTKSHKTDNVLSLSFRMTRG